MAYTIIRRLCEILLHVDDKISTFLHELRPRRTWWSVVSPDTENVWRRENERWDLPAPPEDYALPPDLSWTEELRELVITQYRAEFGQFLEPDEHYEMDWPPRGFLSDPGAWHVQWPSCSEHGEDREDSCDECQGLDHQEIVVVDQPAQWEWTVDVRTLARKTEPNSSTFDIEVDAHEWILGVTSCDPRQVEYGPAKGSPYRAELIRQFWPSDGVDANDRRPRPA